MANPQTLLFTWTPNSEPDLLEYRIRWSTVGTSNLNATFQVTPAQFSAAGNTWTIIPSTLPAQFPYDGVYAFYLEAVDTSSNVSGRAGPTSKRVIRTGNKIKLRR